MTSRVRLAYGTNVAPQEDVAGIVAAMDGLWADVARRCGETPLGLGLWIPALAAHVLARDAEGMRSVRAALARNGLELVTVNAFPAGGFHADVVKEAVYRPDWTAPERFAYTSAVARTVAGIVAPGSDVTISTLPLGFPKLDVPSQFRAAGMLFATVLELHRLREATGTTIRLALEPEPCCALETVAEAVEFFGVAVRPFAKNLRAGGLTPQAAEEATARHLGVCLDLCHAAVEHEDPVAAYERLTAAGLPVFKVQVSAAVEVPEPGDEAMRAKLARFVEPRWLHQVGVPGEVVLDLPAALADPRLSHAKPWRVHFHVPLSAETVGGLPTTRRETARFLAYAAALDSPPVLEIETYTWSVVPDASADLAGNVADEITWVRDALRP
jgi:sugar phosphate isomerase/epimerase